MFLERLGDVAIFALVALVIVGIVFLCKKIKNM